MWCHNADQCRRQPEETIEVIICSVNETVINPVIDHLKATVGLSSPNELGSLLNCQLITSEASFKIYKRFQEFLMSIN
ncbi:hypothetical protein F3Y22_tig00117005pilonHSYRG00466 [Hibiscus syriacus]|uniref:Uncharacterized protein n=1 Tax=Hibiscus syriacus TaxID=106335 RepID=A0A6A2WFJ4_HIBSY|nr:hypothetical protein F3Y22_tig00117005pilonHSYRG00466 [Hibiscus syriacus]